MGNKYNITARKGDKRILKPRLQGHDWTDHEFYGKRCTVIQEGAVYDVQLVHIDGMDENAVWWANGDELEKIK